VNAPESSIREAEQPASGALAAAYDDARLRILRSLERAEIDVAEATRRLEALDNGPDDPDGRPEPEAAALAIAEADESDDVDDEADTETARFSPDEPSRG
jgi:hypothetical protein